MNIIIVDFDVVDFGCVNVVWIKFFVEVDYFDV